MKKKAQPVKGCKEKVEVIHCFKCGSTNITVTDDLNEWTAEQQQEAEWCDCLDMALCKCVCGHYWWQHTANKPERIYDADLCPRCQKNLKNKLNFESLCDACVEILDNLKRKIEAEKAIKDAKSKGITITSNHTTEKISEMPFFTTKSCFLCGKSTPHFEYPLPLPLKNMHICMDCADEIGYSELHRDEELEKLGIPENKRDEFRNYLKGD